MTFYIFGHKNPDTDSVASCIAFSYLKNQLGFNAVAGVLGSINKESRFVLDYFRVPVPKLIENVKTQVADINIDRVSGVSADRSILWAYKLMASNNYKTLAVTDSNNKLTGIITMKDIAMSLISGDFYTLNTSTENIASALGGHLIAGENCCVRGKIVVVAYKYDSMKSILNEDTIVIVGDRYDVIEYAIDLKVKLIIITGGRKLPENYLNAAILNKVPVISVSTDTYTTSKLINECNFISTIMKNDKLVAFYPNFYLDEVEEEILSTSFRNYPVVDDSNTFLGFLSRKHILNPGKKKVILVDHNEYGQSADGLDEAEIVEIVDHHKLGDISTHVPISFRNIPVGSTCTIIFYMFKEYRIEPSYEIAGLLLSGILSDTLAFKSPTTTEMDKKAAEELNLVLNLDIESYSTSMFKAGTSLEGHSIEEIFYKDFKEFSIDQYELGISQVFTLDIESVFNRKEHFIELIGKIHKDKEYFLTLMLVTDILKEGSYLFFQCKNENVISVAFNIEVEQGAYVPHTVSRKKQIIPKILEAINILR
ncbi:MAG: putative manganese-dependent inorganic diphosphatase [Clostridia bacterium]|nr:putative manganese-dependent inorganic diphosphatase [Clostridia bacterium]